VPTIEAQFAEYFPPWGIRLPEEAIRDRTRGKLIKGGWCIWYLFGSDQRSEYLDYYAVHRITHDSHVQIREDRAVEFLPALEEVRLSSDDPEEDARLETAFFEGNQRIAEILEAKGFALAGDEPLSVKARRVQLTRPRDSSSA